MELHINLTFLIKRQHLYKLPIYNAETLFIGRREPIGKHYMPILSESH